MVTIADQPFQILLGLVQEHKLDPWDVDIEKLAGVYLQRVREMQEFDLRVSGRTLLSASVLLRMKSDFVLNGRGKSVVEEGLEEVFDLDLPELGQVTIVQRSPRKITLLDLIGSLQEALKDIPARKPHQRRRLEKIIQTLSEYHINIERYLEELYQRIKSLVASGQEIPLSALIPERTRLAIARTLLLLLFLSAQGRVLLQQPEPFGEIFASVPAGEE
ncbi:MAG: segregation/condensation protein A [Candidatus Hadarchaeaceae archaeon]